MGEILNFIEKRGEGKYHFYKTKKISIDTTDSEVLDYDDKPVSATKTSKIAETDWKSHTNLTHPGKYFRPSKVKIMRPTSPK